MSSQMCLSSELIAAVRTLKLPHAFVASQVDTQLLQCFECFVTDVTAVRSALLVLAGLVAEQSAFLGEALLADVTAVGSLAGVCAVVLIQTRLGPECLPTEVTLVRLLAAVYT